MMRNRHEIDRRTFLKMLGLAAAGAALSPMDAWAEDRQRAESREMVFQARLKGSSQLPSVFTENTAWKVIDGRLANTDSSVLWTNRNITLNEKVTTAEFTLDTDDARFALVWKPTGGYSLCGSYFSVTRTSLNMHETSSDGTMTPVLDSREVSLETGRHYILKACKELHENMIQLLDGRTGRLLASVESVQTSRMAGNEEFPGGRQMSFAGIKAESGRVSLYQLKVETTVPRPMVVVYGDSITEGDRCYSHETYGYLMKRYFGSDRVALSGFSGSKVDGVIERIQCEIAPMRHKPRYIMVSIGTNGGNTQELFNRLKDVIEGFGCIPVINVPSGACAKEFIMNLDCMHTRFDIATSIMNAEDDTRNLAYFVDGLHPNKLGHQKYFDRMKIDLPELFAKK